MLISCSGEKYVVERKSGIEQVNKKNISGHEFYSRSYNDLISSANMLLNKKFNSVLDKKIESPSGNKQDYVSTAIYYWPAEGGGSNEPWVYKDGKINKEVLKETDHSNYYSTLGAVKRLSLAYYFSGDLKYAKKTAELIRLWFTDDSTKMNPNFNYAQGIPGKLSGTPSGIIDSRAIIWVIQALELIDDSGQWDKTDDLDFKNWCKQFLFWLRTSEFGQKESKTNNNHGSFYDLQIASFSSYLGEDNLANSIIEGSKKKRIEKQILPDGSQPMELKRASAFTYSIFNLSALFNLALLGNQYNNQLWNYKGNESGSIKDALDFLIEMTIVKDEWSYSGSMDKKELLRFLYTAVDIYGSDYQEYINLIEKEFQMTKLTDLYFVY
jgi:hypothetical protein